MKTRIVRIGNSQGVRIPKPFIEQAALEEEVEMRVEDGAVIIQSVRKNRAGWAEAARLVRERGEDALPDTPATTDFDENEWQWP